MTEIHKNPEKDYPDYLRDESRKTGMASSISFPLSEQEIVETLQWADSEHIPVTTQGARTGLTGGAVPVDGHILNLSRMKKILGMSYDKQTNHFTLTVEPGVLLGDIRAAIAKKEFNTDGWTKESLEALALFKAAGSYLFPPDLTEITASIGGMASCNASGARSYHYGATRAAIRGIRLVLADGDCLNIRRGQCMADGLQFRLKTDSGRIVEGVLPHYEIPNVKSAAGYYIKSNMDMLDLFIGSEGTLGIMSELELDLIPAPSAVWGVTTFFHDEKSALLFVHGVRALENKPVSIEFIDSRALNLLRAQKAKGQLGELPDIPESYHTAVYVEYHADSEEAASDLVMAMCEVMESCGGNEDWTWIATDDHERERLRQFRHAVPESVNSLIDERRKADSSVTKLGTDMAVPDDKLDEVMALYHSSLEKLGLDYVIFGHIGNNHVHVNILPRTREEYDKGMAQYLEWAKAVVQMGGTVSAEHGIGKIKTPFLKIMLGEEGITGMRNLKKLFDPACMLNPGNLFPC